MSGAQLNSHLQNVSAAQLSAYFSERERHSERRSNERISVKLWLIKKVTSAQLALTGRIMSGAQLSAHFSERERRSTRAQKI